MEQPLPAWNMRWDLLIDLQNQYMIGQVESATRILIRLRDMVAAERDRVLTLPQYRFGLTAVEEKIQRLLNNPSDPNALAQAIDVENAFFRVQGVRNEEVREVTFARMRLPYEGEPATGSERQDPPDADSMPSPKD